MSGKMRKLLLASALAVVPLGLSGCEIFSMGIFTPIPVPPWVSTRIEEKYQNKTDFQVAIMPPIRPGFPEPLCEDPPDEAHIWRSIRRIPRGVPYVYEEFRDNVQFVTERLVDRIDPPRFYPLVGWARLHHCHYKCTVYFLKTVQSDYPFPYKIVKPSVEVVYIDKDHLHLEPGGNPETRESVTRDLLGP